MDIQKERMPAREMYQAVDPGLAADNRRAMALTERFNASPAADADGRQAILRELLGRIGDGSEIQQPLCCDYGQYISTGSGRRPGRSRIATTSGWAPA